MVCSITAVFIERKFLKKKEISLTLSSFAIYLAIRICFAFLALIIQANAGVGLLFSFLHKLAFWYTIWGIFASCTFIVVMLIKS
jgi:hypothetical protein